MSTNNNSAALIEEISLQKEFVQKAEKVFVSFRKYTPDLKLLKEVLDFPVTFEIFETYGTNLVKDMTDYFQAGVTQKFEENNKDFMAFIKKLFLGLTDRQKLKFAVRFVEVWQEFHIDYAPYFAIISVNRAEIIESLLEKMAENPEDIDQQLFQELRWYTIVTPTDTLLKIMFGCARAPRLIPMFLELCQSLPSLFYNKKLKTWHSEYEVDKQEPILNLLFQRLFFEGRCRLTTVELWENVDKLAISLVKVLDDGAALMDNYGLLDVVLTELYNGCRDPMKSVEILTRIAARILDDEYSEQMNFKFSLSLREPPSERLFLTPTIISMLLKMCKKYQDKSRRILENVYCILKSISVRMTKEEIQFDQETSEHILTELMELPWWMEHAISTWFEFPLQFHKRRVSSEIFHALPLSIRNELYIEIPPEAGTMTSREGYLADVLELASIDADVAMELFKNGCIFQFKDVFLENVIEKLLWHGEVKNVPVSESERAKFYQFLHAILTTLKHKGNANHVDELMRGPVAMEEKTVTPCTDFRRSEPIRAIMQPLPPVWPQKAFKMPKVDIQEVKRQEKERDNRVRQQLANLQAEREEILRQKWIAAGVRMSSGPTAWSRESAYVVGASREDDLDLRRGYGKSVI